MFMNEVSDDVARETRVPKRYGARVLTKRIAELQLSRIVSNGNACGVAQRIFRVACPTQLLRRLVAVQKTISATRHDGEISSGGDQGSHVGQSHG